MTDDEADERNPEPETKLTFREMNEILEAQGWVKISPWWWNFFETLFAIGWIRNWVIRGGRRGGKSSSLMRFVVWSILYGDHVVPIGDVGYFAILSADKDQAQERLDTCHKILNALHVAHRKTANEITLSDKNVGIKAFAATTTAVVSFTAIGFLCDEMSRWKDRDSDHNPALEVLRALRPTTATMPNAKCFYVSAPFSTLDEHHKMVELGDTDLQRVFIGTTPEMNPTLSEATILQLEPDEATRMREYYVVPMSSDESKFFASEFIDEATSFAAQLGTLERTAAGADFAFRRNSSAAVALEKHGDVFSISVAEERVPGVKALRPSATITELAGICVGAGADSIACDLHYIESVREHVEDLPIELLEYPSHKNETYYVRFRVLLSTGKIDLRRAPPRLIEQLKATTGKPLPHSSGLHIDTKASAGDKAHGDLVSSLIAALWAHEQAAPEKTMGMGARRYSTTTRHEMHTDSHVMHDLPPED